MERPAELLITRLAGWAKVGIRIRSGSIAAPSRNPIRRSRGAGGLLLQRHPEAGDLLLVIEVADSSVLYERVEKTCQLHKVSAHTHVHLAKRGVFRPKQRVAQVHCQ